jgi:hypothetical protein
MSTTALYFPSYVVSLLPPILLFVGGLALLALGIGLRRWVEAWYQKATNPAPPMT